MDHWMNAVGMMVAVRTITTATATAPCPLFRIEESLGEWIVLDFQRRHLIINNKNANIVVNIYKT